MKKIILFIILLSIPALGQVKKNVFNTQQRDTIKTLIADSAAILRGEIADLGTDSVGVKGLISDTANALRAEWQGDISDSLANFTSGLDTATVDSLARAAIGDSLGNYVDKSTAQTITGQKNFMGTVKFGSDTTMRLGLVDDVGVRSAITINQLAHPTHPYTQNRIFKSIPLDANTGSWSLTTAVNDFIPGNDGVDHTVNLGYNHDSALPNHPQFGFQLEAQYEAWDTINVYEWFSYFNDKPISDYSVRTFQMAVYMGQQGYFSSRMALDADEIWFGRSTGAGSDNFRFANDVFFLQNNSYMFAEGNDRLFLYQRSKLGGAVELARVDSNDNVVIHPSGSTNIELRRPVIMPNQTAPDLTGVQVGIYNDNGNLKVIDGFGEETRISGSIIIPTDSSLLGSGKYYGDMETGTMQFLVPRNLVFNGNFTDWTGDDPDGWVVSPEDTGNYVTETDGKMTIVVDGTQIGWAVYQDLSDSVTNGVTYGYSFVVTAITDTMLFGFDNQNLVSRITEVGYYSGKVTTTNSNGFLSFVGVYGAASITIDNVRLWELGGEYVTPTNPYTKKTYVDSLFALSGGGIDSTKTIELIHAVMDSVETDTLRLFYSVVKVNPDSSESFTLTRTVSGITIDSVFVLIQGTDTSEVTFNIAYGTNRTSGTDMFTSDQTADNITVGETFTTINEDTVPVNNMVWLKINGILNDPTEFLCVIYYH